MVILIATNPLHLQHNIPMIPWPTPSNDSEGRLKAECCICSRLYICCVCVAQSLVFCVMFYVISHCYHWSKTIKRPSPRLCPSQVMLIERYWLYEYIKNQVKSWVIHLLIICGKREIIVITFKMNINHNTTFCIRLHLLG